MLDSEAIQSAEKALDTGLPTTISGKVSFSNIPPLIAQQMQSLESKNLVANMPVTHKRTLVVSLEILDNKNKSLYKITKLDMQMIQQGRKIVKWQGASLLDGITIILDFYPDNPEKMDINFEMIRDNNYPVIYLNRIRIIQAIQQAKRLHLRELTLDKSFGESSIENIQFNIIEPIPESEIEIAETLVEVLKCLNVEIQFPERYNSRDVIIVRTIRQILSSGRVKALIDVPDLSSGLAQMYMDQEQSSELVSKFEEAWRNGEKTTIYKTISILRFNLFGHKIMLGKRAIVLHVLSIDKINEATNGPEFGKETMEVNFSFDVSESFTVYHDWCSSEDKANYFPIEIT